MGLIRKRRRIASRPESDPRDTFIARVVQGRSFCDVGGLWGTTSEKVTVAARAGATRVAMIDITPPGDDLWKSFHERLASMGVGAVECIPADITSTAFADRFDVVHCSGVLYHTPNPVDTLAALRRTAGDYLILTSVVVPHEIRNQAGQLSFSAGQALFLPYLSQQELSVLHVYLKGVGVTAVGIDIPVAHWSLDDYRPWWWLLTASAVGQMLAVAGFEVEEEASYWDGKAQVFLARCA